jgi:hypothetical protein
MKRETWLSDVLTSGLMILHLPHNILWGHIERDPGGRPAGTRGDKAGHKNATGQSRLPELGVGRTVAYIISEPMQRCTAELPLQPGGEIARRTSLKTPACT